MSPTLAGMRIYLPASVADLAADRLTPRPVSLVTDHLRAAYPAEGEEDLEMVAFLAAADASLQMLQPDATPARVVIAADVADGAIAQVQPGQLTAARLTEEVTWSAVVSIHTDDPGDHAGARLVSQAIAGQPEAVIAAADLDLLWFDVSERGQLRALFG